MLRTPPDILITTPESLFLLLTSQARETLRGIEIVILDEVHAVGGTKRGAHLALSLERLEQLVEAPFQRVGLSATQRPLEEIGRFVAGTGREIRLVDAGVRKELDLQVVVPVEDMRELGSTDLRRARRSPTEWRREPASSGRPLHRPRSIRRSSSSCAPLDHRLRQQPPPAAPRAPHQRAGRGGWRVRTTARRAGAARRRRVAQGRTDPVPRRDVLARARHRHGRGRPRDQVEARSRSRAACSASARGHDLHSVSKGRIFPKFRADLLESAVVARAMRQARSRRRASRATRSTSWPSRSSRSARTRR